MLQVTLMQIPLQQSWCVKSNVGFSSSDWVCDHTLNNIASVQECFKKCGKMSYKDQISGSLTTEASLSEYNTDDVFVDVCDIHTFLQRTTISAILKSCSCLSLPKWKCVWGVAPVINKCKGSIHALFPLYLACSRSWTMCSCPLHLAINRGVTHCVKRQLS